MKKLLIVALALLPAGTYSQSFTAKEARTLATYALDTEQKKVYDYVKTQIYQQAEQKQFGVVVVIDKKRFGFVYANKTDAQSWTWLMIIKARLEVDGYNVDLALNGTTGELFLTIKW
jgi:hypothetical protein